jgi:hypothetical protein
MRCEDENEESVRKNLERGCGLEKSPGVTEENNESQQ